MINIIRKYLRSSDVEYKRTLLSQLQKWIDDETIKLSPKENEAKCILCNKEFNITSSNKTAWTTQTRTICTYFDPLDIIGSEYALETSRINYVICPHCGNMQEYQKEIISLEE